MKRQFQQVAVILLLTAFPFAKLFSNGLTISSLSTNQANQEVSFTLTWNNSWRSSSTSAANWDAAWVFVKWRACTDPNSVAFTHGLVSTTVSDHTFGGSTILEPTLQNGAVGIDPSPNNTGVMLRNVQDPFTGTVTASVTLKISNLPTTGSLDLRVYGLEMVYVPQGAYILGDGNGSIATTVSANAFVAQAYLGMSPQVSAGIGSENSTHVYESSISYCPAYSISSSYGDCNLSAAFPKGFNAFYIMKYEISEKDYVNFLNSSPSTVQWAQYNSITLSSPPGNRYRVAYDSTTFTYITPRPDRAMNWLSWADAGTFLDWAALRPLTELQFEKASRGSLAPVQNEGAWGSTTAVRAAAISGTENGTETINTASANVCIGSSAFTGGDAGAGPLRCGIFATPTTTTRQQTGGSFYGVMELSGNVSEYYISARAGVDGPSAAGVSLGDGNLGSSVVLYQHFTNTDWPNGDAPNSPGNNIIRKGGNWQSSNEPTLSGTVATSVSCRNGGFTFTRDATMGGRGGR